MHPLPRLLLALLLAALPAFAAAQIDINRANARTLAEALKGVGLVKAEAIVAYREAHGPFRRIEDLAKVKGVGAHTIEQNRAEILIVEPAGEGAAKAGKRSLPDPPRA